MFQLIDVSKIYINRRRKKEVHALSHIDLTFKPGEFVSIVGLSGSGKSTLVNLIGGLDKPTKGSIHFHGINTTKKYKEDDWNRYRKNNIGFVFQDFNLINHLSALENVELALSLSGVKKKLRNKRALELLEMVGMSDRSDHLPNELSGGQKQRVAIARALANNPDIIIADEPTGALDPFTTKQILTLLKDLSTMGHLIIMVTHNQFIAQKYSTRMVYLEDGKVAKEVLKKEVVQEQTKEYIHSKSKLSLDASLKIAFNNLRLRKKSTAFSIFGLVPGVFLMTLLVNFTLNTNIIRKDLNVISNRVLPNDRIVYISPMEDTDVDFYMRKEFENARSKTYDYSLLNSYRDQILFPLSNLNESIKKESLVQETLDVMYYDVRLNGEDFVINSLLPKEYKAFDQSIPSKYYPNDSDEGVIITEDVAQKLVGKYNKATDLKGKTVEIELITYKGVPLHYSVATERRKIQMKVLDVITERPKTLIAQNLYKNYMYIPYHYSQKILGNFKNTDFSLTSVHLVTNPKMEYIPDGMVIVEDPLRFIKNYSELQQRLSLYVFKEFDYRFPVNNYALKKIVVLKNKINKEDITVLSKYGTVSRSLVDEESAYQTKSTYDTLNRFILLLFSASAGIIAIPGLLVMIILYISILTRDKEIGVIKAMGGRRGDIEKIFVLESTIIGIFGSIVGSILGIIGIFYSQQILDPMFSITKGLGTSPFIFNLYTPFIVIFTITLITSFMGYLPGRKASKFEVTQLLYHD